MVAKNEMMAEIGGAAVGALQTPLLRQYLDPKYPALISQLGRFGTPSAVAGIALGGIALVAALYANAKRKLSDVKISALETYGTVALVGGVLSAFYPAVAVTTVGMAPQVQTAQRTYVAPLVPSYNRMDMEALQKMSGEIQRLSGENAQLRTMVQSMQEVVSKQRQYSFMDPNAAPHTQAMVAPGQAMPGAKAFGFMADGSLPLAKIQAMRSYGFLG